MGRVFSFRELSEARVPTRGAFSALVRSVRRALIAEPAIAHALIHGSAASRSHTCRSDLDLILVHREGAQRPAQRCVAALKQSAARCYIPLGAELLGPDNRTCAPHRRVSGGVLFVQTLALSAAAGGLVKGDPIPFVHIDVDDPAAEVAAYAIARTRVLLERGRARRGSRAAYSRLSMILRTPIHLSRKWLQASGVALSTGRRGEVVQAYAAARGPGADTLLAIDRLDQAYTREVERQRAQLDAARYQRVLRAIVDAEPQTLAFLGVHAARPGRRRG
jgi:hypothetical protein